MNIMLDLSAANKNDNVKTENTNDKDENIIQQDVLRKIKDEIIERIETTKANSNKESDNIINTPITYNSILISGSRGAGKTSFLFSL